MRLFTLWSGIGDFGIKQHFIKIKHSTYEEEERVQSSRGFLRNTLWYFIPFLIMTVISIISLNFTFKMLQEQNYEMMQNQLQRDMQNVEAKLYKSKETATEISLDADLYNEKISDQGINAIKGMKRLSEYRQRIELLSTLFLAYEPDKIITEVGIGGIALYCSKTWAITDESKEMMMELMENRCSVSCLLEKQDGSQYIVMLYYFPETIYVDERWVGFLFDEAKLEKVLLPILGDMDGALMVTFHDQKLLEVNQLSNTISQETLAQVYEVQGKKDNSIPGYTVMVNDSKALDLKTFVMLSNNIFVQNLRKQQFTVFFISILAFLLLSVFLWMYGKLKYKKAQAVQLLAMNLYPEMTRDGIKGEYELIHKVLERAYEGAKRHDQMFAYYRKESKRQLTWLLLKSSPPEDFQVEELMENCGIRENVAYYCVLDFLLVRDERNLDFLDDTDQVLMYYLDKNEMGIVLMVVIALETRDKNHTERLRISENILQELISNGYVCKGITSGLVYERPMEIHSSQEEAFSLLSTFKREHKQEKNKILFFGESARLSQRVPHITTDRLQEFKEALVEGRQKDAFKAVTALLTPPSDMAEELLTYARYKIIQIILDVYQVKGVSQEVVNELLRLVKLEGDVFEEEVKKSILVVTNDNIVSVNADDVLKFIKDNVLNCDISRQSVADFFGITEREVNHIMMESVGKNYKAYINELRLDKASELLAGAELDIKTIAKQIGYYNVTSFNRWFKQMCGMTPSEYRLKQIMKETNGG